MKRYVFKGQVPDRFNIEILREDVYAVEPDVVIDFQEQIDWNDFPFKLEDGEYDEEHEDYPDDPSLPWVEEATLIFSNVPDGYTKQQVGQFILNHVPTETTDEKRERLEIEQIEEKVGKSPTIADIITRLEALEGA